MNAPFPYFGGKSRIASLVWERFGNVANYVEPFAGSLAVLLGRPHAPRTETVNDKDGHVANFWRSVSLSPDAVAEAADWPVNEADLHARHLWLVRRTADLTERLMADPDFHDPKAAGWWLWGICQWIGSGWCSGEGPWTEIDGVFTQCTAGMGVKRKLPHLGNAGMGVNRKLPHLGDAGKGVNRQLPHLGDAGRGAHILAVCRELQARLRDVRVCCGDWMRVMSEAATTSMATRNRMLTAILLDPPYLQHDRADVYAHDCGEVAHAAAAWAIENGDNPLLRIAFCGYDGNHAFPATWDCVPWKANGGYAAQGDGQGRANAARERIWFSPHCLSRTQYIDYDLALADLRSSHRGRR